MSWVKGTRDGDSVWRMLRGDGLPAPGVPDCISGKKMVHAAGNDGGQPAVMSDDDVPEHVGTGAAAQEADDGGARNAIRVAAARRCAVHASRPS